MIGEKGLEQVDPSIRAAAASSKRCAIADLVEAQERRAALAVKLRRFHQHYALLLTPIQDKPVPKVGLQIVGPPLGDVQVLKAARAYELVAPFPRAVSDTEMV